MLSIFLKWALICLIFCKNTTINQKVFFRLCVLEASIWKWTRGNANLADWNWQCSIIHRWDLQNENGEYKLNVYVIGPIVCNVMSFVNMSLYTNIIVGLSRLIFGWYSVSANQYYSVLSKFLAQKVAKHKIIMFTRISSPAKISCHMYHLWLVSCSFLPSRKFFINIYCLSSSMIVPSLTSVLQFSRQDVKYKPSDVLLK